MGTRTIGSALQKLRKAHNKTIVEMASECHVSKQAWTNYEHNRRTPDIESLDDFAGVFSVSLDYLTGRSTYEYNPQDPWFKALMSEFVHMDTKKKQALVKAAQNINRRKQHANQHLITSSTN